jgi:hypothetical protein
MASVKNEDFARSPLRLTGIGLRTSHYTAVMQQRPKVAWLEVHTENYFGEGGNPIHTLETLRKDYPISLHGVGMSLGSSDELNWAHLKKCRDLIKRINPCLVSDHLSWSSFNGRYFHDLFPLQHSAEMLKHLVNRIQQIQSYLNQQILIENISSYVEFTSSQYSEVEFLIEVAQQSGCGLLLDLNNLYINAHNFQFNANDYLKAISPSLVHEFHLAGHTSNLIQGKSVLIDTHDQIVAEPVWNLYREAIQHLGCKPTIIEWDQELPELQILCDEAQQAETIMRESYARSKSTC